MTRSDCIIEPLGVMTFMNPETERLSVWVYEDLQGIHAYPEPTDNADEVWFCFHKFSRFYWQLMESECIDDVRGNSFYNYTKLKLFMIRRMLHSTSLGGCDIRYDSNGFLVREAFDWFMRIHPRILRVLFDKMNVLPPPMPDDEKREYEKQCAELFGKGDGITNPHPFISLYCNLAAFWDKFGINYFDMLKLPQEVFSALKQTLTLDNVNKSAKMDEMTQAAQRQSQRNMNPHGRGNTHSVRF